MVTILLVAVCAGICAQQTKPVPTAPRKAESKRSEVTGGADVTRGPWDGKGITVMKGNVWFQHEDTRITSDLIEYDGRENVKTAVSPGKIKITNPECDITGDKGTAFFQKRLGVIEGNVVAVLKPKQETAEPAQDDSIRAGLRKPTTITCAKLEYLYRDKVVTASGGVVFQQEKRRASAEGAVYDQNSELLTLTGNVQAADEEGQRFSAPKAVISLKKGDEWIEAPNAKATFKIDLGEEDDAAEAP